MMMKSSMVVYTLIVSSSCHAFVVPSSSSPQSCSRTIVPLHMSLKPAAMPLMDAGKALARSGELLIETTSILNVYGGGLSAAGAQIRNAGDCVAQAAASCRFKTAKELVCDELREAATCLEEARGKMKLAVEEAQADDDMLLATRIEPAVKLIGDSHVALEAAGAGILQRSTLAEIGGNLIACGNTLELLSVVIRDMAPNVTEAEISSQRMAFGAERMKEAGTNLVGTKQDKPKGKAWLKG